MVGDVFDEMFDGIGVGVEQPVDRGLDDGAHHRHRVPAGARPGNVVRRHGRRAEVRLADVATDGLEAVDEVVAGTAPLLLDVAR